MRVLRIEVNDLQSRVLFYIDGNLVATHTTGLPASGTRLGPWIGVTASAAVVSTMDIDYIRIWSDDPDTVAPRLNTAVAPAAIDFELLK